MWLCTKLGFYSIVRKGAGEIHVRARCAGDLQNLASALATATHGKADAPVRSSSLCRPVKSHPGSDYPWRIILHSDAELALVMQALTASIDYPNFKSAIAASTTQRDKLGAYHDIHHRMVEWQEQRPSQIASGPRRLFQMPGIPGSNRTARDGTGTSMARTPVVSSAVWPHRRPPLDDGRSSALKSAEGVMRVQP